MGACLATSSSARGVARFGNFELDLGTGELRRDGLTLRLQPQPAKILTLLVSRPGEVITRTELAGQVWGSETFVDFEGGLNFAIRQIRATLEDNAEQPQFLETLPKRGYRFIASLKPTPPSPAELTSQPTPPVEQARHFWTVGIAALMLVAVAAVAYSFWIRHAPPVPLPGKIRLAVLPFQNLTGQPAQEFVSDGFTEEMITQLGGVEHDRLSIIARTSSMAYKNTTKPVSQIGRELDVQYVLEGSVRSWGDRIRVTAQLIQTSDQSHLWAQNYESERKDILRIQSEITEAISEQIRLSLSAQERAHLGSVPSVDPEVYELCLLGRYESTKRSEAGLAKSIDYFQQAIARNPAYAPAYSGLAEVYLVSAFYGRGSPRNLYDKAEAAAQHAVQLNEMTFQAHTILGMVASSYLRRGAAAEFKRALEIAPNYATAHHWYAFDLWRTGLHDESLAELERARQLDPVSPIIGTDESVFLLSAGRDDEAISLLKRTLDFAPRFSEAHRTLAVAYAREGKLSEATAEARTALELNPNNVGVQATLAFVNAITGHRSQAEDTLHVLEKVGDGGSRPWFFEAWIYVGLNQPEKALDCLDHEYQAHTPMMIAISIEPIFASLKSEPRFQNLLQRIQMGQQTY